MKSSSAAVNATVGALLLARTVVGQVGNCEVATADGYSFMFSPQEGFVIQWTIPSDGTISFTVSSEVEAWAAVGFSDDGEMVGTDAVIYVPDTQIVAEYGLEAKSIQGVALTAVSDITDTSSEQVDGTTTFAFTRNLSPDAGDDGKLDIPAQEGTEIYLLWAYGTANTLGAHDFGSGRGAFQVDVFCPTANGVTDDQTSGSDLSATTATTPAPTVAVNPGGTRPGRDTPTSTSGEDVTPAPTVTVNPGGTRPGRDTPTSGEDGTPAPTVTVNPGGTRPGRGTPTSGEDGTPAPTVTVTPGGTRPGRDTPTSGEDGTPAPTVTVTPGGTRPERDTPTPGEDVTAAPTVTVTQDGTRPERDTPTPGEDGTPAPNTGAPTAAPTATITTSRGTSSGGDMPTAAGDMTPAPTIDAAVATDAAGRAAAGINGATLASATMAVCLGAFWARGL